MMTVRIPFLMLMVLAMVMATTGCIAFRGDRLPRLDAMQQLSPDSAGSRPQKVVCTLSVYHSRSAKGKRKECMPSIREHVEQEMFAALRASGQIDPVRPTEDGAENLPIGMDVQITDVTESNYFWLWFIWGTIGPSWGTVRSEVRAKVFMNDGEERQSSLVADAETVVLWLPFIVMMPFKSPDIVGHELQKSLWLNMLEDMRKNGTLVTPSKARAQVSSR